MTPPAFLALWNGVRPGHEHEYEAWHGLEHAPERLGAPGFRAATRYREEGGRDYFTLYELDGLQALETPEYDELMREPTRWSARMRPLLTGFRRLPCVSLMTRRFGAAAALATVRIAGEGEAILAQLHSHLDEAFETGRIHGAILGAARQTGEAYTVFPGAPAPGRESLLLLWSSEVGNLMPAVDTCRMAVTGTDYEVRYWRVLQTLNRGDLREVSARRQAPRDDLLAGWESVAQLGEGRSAKLSD